MLTDVSVNRVTLPGTTPSPATPGVSSLSSKKSCAVARRSRRREGCTQNAGQHMASWGERVRGERMRAAAAPARFSIERWRSGRCAGPAVAHLHAEADSEQRAVLCDVLLERPDEALVRQRLHAEPEAANAREDQFFRLQDVGGLVDVDNVVATADDRIAHTPDIARPVVKQRHRTLARASSVGGWLGRWLMHSRLPHVLRDLPKPVEPLVAHRTRSSPQLPARSTQGKEANEARGLVVEVRS